MIGPGRFDKLAEYCIAEAKAEAVVLIVFSGEKGSGMSASVKLVPEFEVCSRNLQVVGNLPRMLRLIADRIDKDVNREV